MIVNERMRQLLKAKEIPLLALAIELGVSESFVSMAVSGKRRFSLEQSRKLLNIFGAELMSRVIDWEGMHVSCPI